MKKVYTFTAPLKKLRIQLLELDLVKVGERHVVVVLPPKGVVKRN